jgi:type IV pilus assembly protein PilA
MRGDILFGPLFFIGIIAGIAIPAYQDYTIRSQITQGLVLGSAAKAATAEYFATHGTWPADLKQAGFEAALQGPYVDSVTIQRGTVFIRYGREANAWIAGKQLTLRPTVSGDDVTWSCGYSSDAGADPKKGGAAPHSTNVAKRYLPSACRGM